MADVKWKWIKMMVGMFDGMSFKKIKRAKIGGESYRDKLTAVWFELMDLAGKCNHDGAFIVDGIPFMDLEDIAIQIDRDEEELKLCMSFYIREGMVTIEDNVYALSNWGEYQNVEGMEKIREQTRQRVAKCREKKRLQAGNGNGNATVTLGNALEEEGEEDKDLDKDIEIERENESSFDQPTERDFDMFSTDLSTDGGNKRTSMGGELGKGVVLLSQAQIDDLLDKLSIEEFDHYVGVVADCVLSGRPFRRKTHYQAILDMAAADRRVK